MLDRGADRVLALRVLAKALVVDRILCMHRSRGAPQIQHPDEWPQIAAQLRLLPHPQHGKLTHSKSNFTNGIKWQYFAASHAFPLQSPELRIAGCRSSRGPSPWAEETERRKEDEMTQDVADDGNVQG
jgi:hypothetical protein